MKSIMLSVVVICALAVAGIGGTLADFSDSEEEMGDTLQAGSMDLKVNGADDPDVMPFNLTGMIPCKYYDVTKTVANAGTINGWLYIHFKNVQCLETNDKDINGDGVIDARDKPEPEYVAEFGGKVGQQMVDGLGERCDMEQHIDVEIWYCGSPVDLSGYDKDGNGIIKLSELECEQILLGQLIACAEPHDITFIFHLQDVIDPNWPGDMKFAHWPTNCYMGDTVIFDVLFELLQTDYEPPGG